MRKLFVILAIILSLSPLLYLLDYYLVNFDSKELAAYGDNALIEMSTLRASHGEQYLGPYSRFRWNHPGPLLFYCLAPFYLLFNKSVIGLHIAALIINICCFCLIYVISLRTKDIFLFLGNAVCVSAFIVYSGHELFANPLNPFITIVPFGVFLVLSTHLITGKYGFLPLIVFVASFLVQSHIGFSFSVFFITLFSLLTSLFIIPWRSDGEEGSKQSRKSIMVLFLLSFLFLCVLWLPVILEECSAKQGNLQTIFQFFQQGYREHGIKDVTFHLTEELSVVPIQLIQYLPNLTKDRFTPQFNFICSLLLIILLITIFILSFRRNSLFEQNYCLIGLLAISCGFVSLFFIREEIRHYLVQWLSMLGVFCWSFVIASFMRFIWFRCSRFHSTLFVKVCATVMVLVIGSISISYVTDMPVRLPHDEQQTQKIKTITSAIRTYYREHNDPRLHLDIRIREQWPLIAGVSAELSKLAIPFTVGDNWLYMFGQSHKSTGKEKTIIIFGNEIYLRKIGHVKGITFLTQQDDIFVFAQQISEDKSFIY